MSQMYPVVQGVPAEKRARPALDPNRPTVLVIDDDKKILEAFKLFLDAEKCNMLASSDADDAMEKARNHKIDLLITDFYLKTKSSVEIYTLIRKVFPDIPIAVITGYPEYIGEEDVKMFGADFFFTKPLELNKLREVIRRSCFGKKVT